MKGLKFFGLRPEKTALFYLEVSPITRWCPTPDRLKTLYCLCNCRKLEVLWFFLLSPERRDVLPDCVNEIDTQELFVILCLCASTTSGQWHHVFRLSVHLSMEDCNGTFLVFWR